MLAATTLDPTLIAGAVVVVISALATAVVTVINGLSAAAARREDAAERRATAKVTEDNNKKANVLVTTTAEIKELTNSTNSNLQKALELMTEKHAALERKIVQMENEKRETAATRIVTDQQATQALRTPPPEAGEPTEVKIVNEPSEPVPTVPIKIAKEPKTP